jgi:DNA recombination protein RmuC
MLTTVLVGIAVAVLLGVAFLLWQVLQRLEAAESGSKSLSLFQQQLEGLRQEVSGQLSQVNRSVVESQDKLGQRLDAASRVVGEVRQSLGGLGQATEQIIGLGKNMSKELTDLQQVFRPPKMRGGIGEVLLSSLLSDMLPSERFAVQHGFKSGDKVDAIIRLPEGLVPVDAKFPLDNFRRMMELADEKERAAARREFLRDVKKHVEDIARKYILPDEGTLDFALMYIPAENVYYEAVLRDDEGELFKFASERRVVPVSPNSFYAYLTALVRGFRGMKVAEEAQEILRSLDRLHGDLQRFVEDFRVAGKHIGNAQKAFGEAEKRLTRFEDKLGGLRGLKEPERPLIASAEA